MSEALEDRRYGNVTVHFGERGGKYPHGNSLLVEGAEERIVIDPCLGLVARGAAFPRADRVVNSHCHEDHVAGNFLYPDAPWHLHEADAPGICSLDAFMQIFGYPEPIETYWRKAVVDQFHFTPRADPVPYKDGDVFDLGGGVTVRVVHTPGHTRGHCALFVEPDGLLYIGDIDLSSFGPYYGDAWSDLGDFVDTLKSVRAFDARLWATFHHVGVLETRADFEARFDKFEAVIDDRERRLLEYLAEPHTLEDVVAHRFVFRPQDNVPFADGVERRSMSQHIERLLANGRVRKLDPNTYQATPA